MKKVWSLTVAHRFGQVRPESILNCTAATCGRPAISESGSMTVEAVVLVPVVFLFFLASIGMGRFENAQQIVESAARSGAEAAAIAPSPAIAQQQAMGSVSQAVSTAGLACRNLDVSVDTAGLVAGGQVSVSVVCHVELADIVVPGLPGTATTRATEVAPIDPYRVVTSGFSYSEGPSVSNPRTGGAP